MARVSSPRPSLDWDILTVHEASLKGTSDREVVEYAKKTDMLLMPQNQKPVELVELVGARYVFITYAAVVQMVDREIR
ncbi:MAG TPA: DUF5615 family PIN-like protein [Patescibacteria group bacterium]|nr:DUF5615 family PIN-like protein [Patescibacteria group bacterium]